MRNRDTQMGCSGLHRSLEGILRAALPPPPRLSLLLQLQLQLLPLPHRPCSEPDAALLLSSGSTGTLESPTPPSRRFHIMVFNSARRIPSVSLLAPLLGGAAHGTVGVWVAPCLTIFLPHGRAAAPACCCSRCHEAARRGEVMSWRSPARGGSGRNEAGAVGATCRLLLLPQGSPPPRRNRATALQLLSMVQNSWANVPSMRRGLECSQILPFCCTPNPSTTSCHPCSTALRTSCILQQLAGSYRPPKQHRAHREVEA